jgi:hypothetical protein
MRDMGCHGGHGKVREAMRMRYMRLIEAEEKLEAMRIKDVKMVKGCVKISERVE